LIKFKIRFLEFCDEGNKRGVCVLSHIKEIKRKRIKESAISHVSSLTLERKIKKRGRDETNSN
jgi:hypothetical protein